MRVEGFSTLTGEEWLLPRNQFTLELDYVQNNNIQLPFKLLFSELQPKQTIQLGRRWKSVRNDSWLETDHCELKRPQVIEARAFPRIGCVLITAKIHFVLYLNFKWIFSNWSAWSSSVRTADQTHSNLITSQIYIVTIEKPELWSTK